MDTNWQATRLLPGTRVTATVYGEQRLGTVNEQRNEVVWVTWDGATRKKWMHRDSLTVAGVA